MSVQIGADWQSGNTFKLARSSSIPLTTANSTILAHAITDTDITNGSFSIGLSGVTLSGETYFKGFGNDGTHDSQYLSNVVAWGDTTAPVITTSGTQSLYEQAALAVALTATDSGGVPALVSNGTTPGWYISGGADRLQYQIAVVGGVATLQWINNGTESYYSPNMNPPVVGNPYVVQVTAVDYSGNQSSALTVSTSLTAIDQTPDAFTFTNVSNASLSTLYQSNIVTVTGLQPGFNIPLVVSGTGFQYSVNGGTWKNATGASDTIQNGQTLQLQVTSGASNGVNELATVTIGNPYPTVGYQVQWYVDTPFVPSALFQSGEQGYVFDPSSTANFWQDTAGTVAGAFGSPIGKLVDVYSGGNHHFTQGTSANQPTAVSPGWVSFDGTDDVLTLASVMLFASSTGCSIIAAVQGSSPASDSVWWAEGATANANACYEPGTRITGGTTDLTVFEEPDGGGQNGNSTSAPFGLTVWNNTAHVVSIVADNVSANETDYAWCDRAVGSSHASYSYGRGGSVTLAASGLGACMRATASRWFAGKIGRAIFINRPLTSAERASAEAWCASPYGISLP